MRQREDFLGKWQLDRRIDDRLAGQQSTFTGTALITADGPDGAVYAEAGTLRLGEGASFAAERRYVWTFSEAGVAVRFDDGRAFHSFMPQGQGAGTDHPCGDDYYTVFYEFSDWPNWSSVWTVIGPRKDYRMQTQHKPLA